ncbi:hypothetical protein FACS1894202_05730 [Clostridia bacterium]|nr:hypothetical protein FACS1894202_05730 [Clostridia bacterium]
MDNSGSHEEMIAELRRANAEANAANRAKSDFLSTMSHDIRTPMNAITGMTTIALANLNDPDKVRDCLKKIERSAALLLGLINDILDMSKIESGKMTLNPDDIPLSEIIASLTDVTQPLIAAKNQTFELNMHGVVHDNLYCDSLRLSQVCINILSNAVKFTPVEGHVSLDVTELPHDEEGWATYRFVFRDTGIGMSKKYINDIFSAYSREAYGKTNRIEGSGLGMAICKSIVDMFDGTIEVHSEPGNGSVFTVTLPIKLSEKPIRGKKADSPASSERRIFSGKRILLAEDNEINREIAVELLSGTGAEIDTAENGEEALTRFIRLPEGWYDMILMDVRMPIMDGYDASRRIRKSGKGDAETIPILAMTANAFDEDVADALESGMNGHLAKPIDFAKAIREFAKYLT